MRLKFQRIEIDKHLDLEFLKNKYLSLTVFESLLKSNALKDYQEVKDFIYLGALIPRELGYQ